MIKRPSKIKAYSSQSLLVIIWVAVGIAMSCGHSANTSTQQLKDRPQETPVPFESTTENEGKRCVAHDYFGLHRHDLFGGYTEYCYKLQLRLIAAAREGNLPGIREALKFGANPNLTVDDSYPPLQVAAASGHADAVRLLLDNGAQVNHVSGVDNTPLNAAASYGHMEVVKVLLERGADVCYGVDEGGTAGDIARSRGYREVAELLKSTEKAKCK
jgi:hypothetical protein